MLVHPAVAALRRDPSRQRRTAAAMHGSCNAWFNNPQVQLIKGEMARFSAGEAVDQLPTLNTLLSQHSFAADLVQGFIAHLCDQLRDEPLGEVPLRHSSTKGFARMQLMQMGGAVLSLCVYEPVDAVQEAHSVQFADCEVHELILAGSGQGTAHSRDSDRVLSKDQRWKQGDRVVQRPLLDARQFTGVDQSLLVLQLTRTPSRPRPTIELRISDGTFVRQMSGDKRASEQVMALAVLGALEHREGMTAMKEFACDPGQDSDARWEAVRQVLALDAEQGLHLLSAIASAPDTLAAPATELRMNLLASQPALRALVRENA